MENNLEEIHVEATALSDSVYLKPVSKEKKEILLMLDEETGSTRILVPAKDTHES